MIVLETVVVAAATPLTTGTAAPIASPLPLVNVTLPGMAGSDTCAVIVSGWVVSGDRGR